MRRILALAALAFTLMLAASSLHAQAQFGIALPFKTEGSDIGLEGRVDIPIGSVRGLSITPNVSFFFVEFGTFFTIDGNVHYTVVPSSGKGNNGLYVLGGLDLGVASYGGVTNNEIGLNLGGGYKGDIGAVDLFGELKFVVGNFDTIVLTGGIYF